MYTKLIMRLDNKTILITGANRGIGRALAEELALRSVHLVLGMRDANAYKPIKISNALSITAIELDLSSRQSIDDCLEAAHDTLSSVDILINNAGQFTAGPLADQDLSAIYSLIQVNLTGLMHLTARLLPFLAKRDEAKIVNNASIAGYVYLPQNSTYSASKAGVVAFSEALRRELEGTSVSVLHLVTPGVDTDMLTRVEEIYESNGSPIHLNKIKPQEWAKKIIRAIESDKVILSPNGTEGLLKIIAKGPYLLMDLVSRRMFRR